jgi:hypothetical protein
MFGENCPSSVTKRTIPDSELNILPVIFQLEQFTQRRCCVISLQRFLRAYRSLLEISQGRQVFEWDEWGPNITRWLPLSALQVTGDRSTFGFMMLARGSGFRLHPHSYVDVTLFMLDFNPRPIRRGATTNIGEESHQIVFKEESQWEHPQTGKLIKSSLPYRVFVGSWLPRYLGLRFDGSTLVARKVRLSLRSLPTPISDISQILE